MECEEIKVKIIEEIQELKVDVSVEGYFTTLLTLKHGNDRDKRVAEAQIKDTKESIKTREITIRNLLNQL